MDSGDQFVVRNWCIDAAYSVPEFYWKFMLGFSLGFVSFDLWCDFISRPNTSSALFFKHNSALGPPYQVIVDTNFINFSIQNKVLVWAYLGFLVRLHVLRMRLNRKELHGHTLGVVKCEKFKSEEAYANIDFDVT